MSQPASSLWRLPAMTAKTLTGSGVTALLAALVVALGAA